MKRNATLLLALIMCIAGIANAQRGFQLPEPDYSLPIQQSGIQQNKGTGTGSRLIAASRFKGNAAGTFVPNDSFQYYFPSATTGLYNQTIRYIYGGGTLNESYKTDYTYNAGNLTMTITQQWNTATSTYENFSKFLYTFNSAGYVTNQVLQFWNSASSAWENYNKIIYALDASNRIVDEVIQNWNVSTNVWTNFTHSTYAYNTQGYVMQQIGQDWAAATSTWVNYDKYEYTYDASGTHVTTTIYFSWNVNSNVWVNSYRYVNTLNTVGKPIQTLNEGWNTTTNVWEPRGRVTMTYDASANPILSIIEDWVVATNSYRINYERVQAYNSFNQNTSTTLLYMVSGAYVINVDALRNNFYYEPYTTTGIGGIDNSAAALMLAPNPATTDLHLSVKWDAVQSCSASITDMAGHVYTTFTAPSAKEFSTTLSLADLPAGNYLLSIRGSNGSAASQMITVKH